MSQNELKRTSKHIIRPCFRVKAGPKNYKPVYHIVSFFTN